LNFFYQLNFQMIYDYFHFSIHLMVLNYRYFFQLRAHHLARYRINKLSIFLHYFLISNYSQLISCILF
jgi:hypothetical protein